jgi:hypothetical protein
MLLWPPEPVVFGPHPVDGLSIGVELGQMRLRVRLAGPVAGDIMVFGAAPCSAGRKKWRNGAYLGMLPAPAKGESDITELYVAKYGEPKAGERVFIRIRRQKDGWEDEDKDISGVVRKEPQTRPLNGLKELNELHRLNRLHGLQRGVLAGRVCKRCTRELHRSCPIHTPSQHRRSERSEPSLASLSFKSRCNQVKFCCPNHSLTIRHLASAIGDWLFGLKQPH